MDTITIDHNLILQKRDIFWKQAQNEFGLGKLSLTSQQDIQMEMSRNWAEMQCEQFTLPFFPPLANDGISLATSL
jgi:hypothetical protein